VRHNQQKVARELAELALENGSQGQFRQRWMEYLATRYVGFDMSAMFSSHDGSIFAADVYGSVNTLSNNIGRYVSEMAPADFGVAMRGRTVIDTDIFSQPRRSQMRVYVEHNRPQGIREYMTRVWIRNGAVFWFALSRTRCSPSYKHSTLQAVDDVFPVLAVGEALHARGTPQANVSDWSHEVRLTPGEARVVDLARRGLSNVEISTVLKRSRLTVRNQLISAYKKLQVSNRTELAFVLAASPGAPRPLPGKNAVSRLLSVGPGVASEQGHRRT
jgi:DNA-binding CsgD family transcriptional regulator